MPVRYGYHGGEPHARNTPIRKPMTMTLIQDQYRTPANLEARIALHARFSVNPVGWLPWVFDQFALPATCHILEVGCGNGELWVANGERIPSGWRVVLSDQSPAMVAQARQRTARYGRNWLGVNLDVQDILYADGRFDAVIANHLLYHVPDLAQALAGISRVLPTGGRLYASTMSAYHMDEYWALLDRADCARHLAITRTTTQGFTLEHGAAVLKSWFREVAVCRYEDALAVTEVEPLLAYTRSLLLRDDVCLDAVRQLVQAEIDRHGAFHIGKSAGMFLCRK